MVMDISGAIPQIQVPHGRDVIFHHVQVMNVITKLPHISELSAPLHQDYHANPGPQVHPTHQMHLMSLTVTFLRVALLQLSTIVAILTTVDICGAIPLIQAPQQKDVTFQIVQLIVTVSLRHLHIPELLAAQYLEKPASRGPQVLHIHQMLLMLSMAIFLMVMLLQL